MRCDLVTAVWGSWHVDAFIRFALPSLLAEGNLPAFRGAVDTDYLIHTRRSDALAIRAAPVFQTLSRTVRVEIVTHPDRIFGSPIETHAAIWHSTVNAAKQANRFLGVVIPDMVWADGAFGTLARMIQSGKKAFYASFVRVVSETFSEELSQHNGWSDGVVCAVSPRRLMELAIRHLHPLQAAYFRDSQHFPFHAECVLWPVSDEGFLMRCLANSVLLFHAADYPVNRQFSLAAVKQSADVAFLTDSDAFFGAGLTPLMKDADWYFERRTADLEEVGAWWLDYEGPAHRELARQRLRFHDRDMTEPAWRTAERQSDFFVAQAVVAREMIRIGRALRAMGCRRAAELLATALYTARLRRRWHWPGPVTVFAPSDAAFARLPPDEYRRLLSAGNEHELVDVVMAHVAPDAIDAPTEPRLPLPLATVDGRKLSIEHAPQGLRVNGLAVLERRELPGGHVVCVIDGVLAR